MRSLNSLLAQLWSAPTVEQPHPTKCSAATSHLLLRISLRMSASIQNTTYGPDVYEPSDDTFLLADALAQAVDAWRDAPPLTVLEVGCGSGFVTSTLALLLRKHGINTHIIASDVSRAALDAAQATLAAHGVTGVELLQANLMHPFLPQLARAADLVVFNPPYVVTPDEEVQRGGIAAAWAGGTDGRAVIDAFLQQLAEVLAPGGRAYLVTIAENRPAEICEYMRSSCGMQAEIVMQRRADEELLSIIAFRRETC